MICNINAFTREDGHTLEGVGYYSGENGEDGYILTIDGVNYLAVYDPDDGFRSFGNFHRTSKPQTNKIPAQPVRVKYSHEISQDDGGFPIDIETLRIINANTRRTILRIGTDQSDEFYPTGIMNYYPQALDINSGR